MATGFQKIEPVSKKERVVNSLKEAILSGTLKSGEAIVEGKIAHEFGVGQGLIREALIALEHEGFVQRTPFSGTQVVQISADDAQKIFDVRISLEPLAVFLAGTAANAAAIVELEHFGNQARRAAETQHLDSFFESHLMFRRHIWQLSGNKYLQQALERAVVPLYALYLIRRSSKREGIQTTVIDCLQHQESILASYRSGNFDEAQNTAREFLMRMKKYLKTALSE